MISHLQALLVHMTEDTAKNGQTLVGVSARKIPSGWQVLLYWQQTQRKRTVTQTFQVRPIDGVDTPDELWTEILIGAASCGIALPVAPDREIGSPIRNKIGDVLWGRAPA